MLSAMTQNGGKMVDMDTTVSHRFSHVLNLTEAADAQGQHKRNVRLARLAMLIECEGSITIGMSPPTKTRNRPALYPSVDITNTAPQIIEEARDTLVREGVGFSIKPQRYSSGFGTKLRQDLNVHAFDRVEAVLTLILPYLRSKKDQAEIVLEFIRSRRSAEPKQQYSDREWELTTQVRKLNGRQPGRKALAKAKVYLELHPNDSRSRTTEYFRKYVEMCTELQRELAAQ